MRTFKKVTKVNDETDSVTCNGCGSDIASRDTATEIEAYGRFNGLVLHDRHEYIFDLCESCLVRIMNGLKIPPNVRDYIDYVDVEWGPAAYNAEALK